MDRGELAVSTSEAGCCQEFRVRARQCWHCLVNAMVNKFFYGLIINKFLKFFICLVVKNKMILLPLFILPFVV